MVGKLLHKFASHKKVNSMMIAIAILSGLTFLATTGYLIYSSKIRSQNIYMEKLVFPKKFAIYYGFPSHVNAAAENLDSAAAVFSTYDIIVFGDTLQFPQYTGKPGQIVYPECDQNSHPDHDNTVEIIRKLKKLSPHMEIYGYVSIGGENTNRHCVAEPEPLPLTIAEIKSRIDAWAAMGVTGIFLDEVEYGFGCSRDRQNEILNYVHRKGLIALINGFDPDDVFGTEAVNKVLYNTGYYANTYSSVEMNPEKAPPSLASNDIYLLESFQILYSNYQDPKFSAARSEKLMHYKEQYGIRVATLTTMPDISPPGADCNLLFDSDKFNYAWWSTFLYGFDFMGWGEPLYSSAGVCKDQLPLRPRPDPGEIGSAFTSPVIHGGDSLYTRKTTMGTVEVDFTAHTAKFSFNPSNSGDYTAARQ